MVIFLLPLRPKQKHSKKRNSSSIHIDAGTGQTREMNTSYRFRHTLI